MDEKDEQLNVPEAYKKAFNHADMICTHMPHLLDKIHFPEKEQGEYVKGFQARVKLFKRERNMVKSFTKPQLPKDKSKDQTKDEPGKERDKD